MNRFLLRIAFASTAVAHAALLHAAVPADLKPAPQQAQAAHLAAEVLTRYHYKGTAINDEFSARVFDEYIKSLDGEKLFFLKSDVDRFLPNRPRLGDALLKEDLSLPFAMFNLYQQRAAERYDYSRGLLKKGFSFNEQESFAFSRAKNADWPSTQAEMDDLWRKRVKNDWLRLRLAGKDDKSIAEVLDKRYDTILKRIARVKAADAFQTFMNAYTTSIEPHTAYMGPRAAEDFDISMRLSLVGIGAVLSEVEEYTTIRELVPGGPAALSNQLQVGDRIVGVGQGENGAITDILGWRSSDAVELIRGKADTVVVLDILPADAGPDGQHKLVKLVRKTIKLEEQAAKSSIRTVGEGAAARRIGIITLPSFYADFAARQQGRPDARSATRDVARLLQGLKQQKVDSVLIDLRNNGGGSLVEAVELTGLFIDKGPVVQQRDAEGSVTVHSDTDAGVAWEGPLGVLINRASASASEIFAAAIQDYGRGLIIGEPSFGKGTVQSVVDLDRIGNSRTPQYGELRMTIAQFFRINGGTTQLLGVTPDIQFPGSFDPETFGESSYTNALPYTRVKPADYQPAGDLKPLVPMVSALHVSRVKKDRDFQYLEEDVAELKRLRARTTVSLNEAERRVERDQQEARLKSREARADGSKDADDTANKGLAERLSAFRDDGLQPGERRIQEELSAEKARKAARDVLLDEAVNILGDEVRALQTDAHLAARVLPRSAQTLVTQ